MQSAAEHVLAVLDRRHTPGRAVEAAHEARAAGFEHVNLDLIYGAPGESDADWAASLDAVLAGPVDHVSAYALIVEEGTRLARRIARGELPMPDDDVLADRYEQADATLRRGRASSWYEVSNWATGDAARCRHNELYWANANWWGIGPGAHSHVGGLRWWNVKHPAAYADRLAAGREPGAGRRTARRRRPRAGDGDARAAAARGPAADLLSATGRDRADDAVARGCSSRTRTPPVAPSSPTAGGCSPTPWSATSPTEKDPLPPTARMLAAGPCRGAAGPAPAMMTA